MSVLDEIRKLDEQKAALLETAKRDALEQAQAAIATLEEIGFSYQLVEKRDNAEPNQRKGVATGSGTRRTGIRDQVLQVIKESKGMKAGDVIEVMGARGDKSASQSVANALSALKRAGTLTAEGGVYKSA